MSESATRQPVPAVEGSGPVARMAGMVDRLRSVLTGLPSLEREAPGALSFLEEWGRALAGEVASDPGRGVVAWGNLVRGLELDPEEVDLVILAGLAEEHEGLASLLETVHPAREPWPSLGLAARLLASHEQASHPAGWGHERIRAMVASGRAVSSGLLRAEGAGPLFRRSVRLAPGVWSVIRGADAWPRALRRWRPHGMAEAEGAWELGVDGSRVVRALRGRLPVWISVVDQGRGVGEECLAALARRAGVPLLGAHLRKDTAEDDARLLGIHALLRGAVPVLVVPDERPERRSYLDLHPGPVVALASDGGGTDAGSRPLLEVRAEPPVAGRRARLWAELLPELAKEAPRLGATYAGSPGHLAELATDVRAMAALEDRAPELRDVVRAVATRAAPPESAGITRRTPRADFDDLVLPEEPMRILREAVDRMRHQIRVLEGWGFLDGRPGARGVRLLLSGPPGTGKTLSAEVLAGELGVDLLMVDVSRLVSKWIGETEKNLARVFDAAERSHAVLLFDEADALFARRTEVSDANARYANLETAYLLTRLERFEGMVVLSTNLKRNVDPAFLRRLEFVVDYQEPGSEERLALWRHHLPDAAPLHPDVRLEELASLYPVTGGLIRNAAVAAGFLAAAGDRPIAYRDLVHAVRREYQKAGRAFPGAPRSLS